MASNWKRCEFLPCMAALLAALFAAAKAPAQAAARTNRDLEACIDLHESAQLDSRRAGLLLARWKLERCSTELCPALVREDCANLKRQLLPRIPSIVPAATDASGRDLVDVSVWIDGNRMLERLDGSALDVNPGEHEVRFETAAGEVVKRRIRVSEGHRFHPVRVAFRQPAKPDIKKSSLPAAAEIGQERRHPIPTTAYVLAGVSALALVSWGVFGISAFSGKSALEECRPGCSKDEVDAVRTHFLIADVSFAAAVLGAAGAAYVVLDSRTQERVSSAHPRLLGAAASAAGARAELAWSF